MVNRYDVWYQSGICFGNILKLWKKCEVGVGIWLLTLLDHGRELLQWLLNSLGEMTPYIIVNEVRGWVVIQTRETLVNLCLRMMINPPLLHDVIIGKDVICLYSSRHG